MVAGATGLKLSTKINGVRLDFVVDATEEVEVMDPEIPDVVARDELVKKGHKVKLISSSYSLTFLVRHLARLLHELFHLLTRLLQIPLWIPVRQ